MIAYVGQLMDRHVEAEQWVLGIPFSRDELGSSQHPQSMLQAQANNLLLSVSVLASASGRAKSITRLSLG